MSATSDRFAVEPPFQHPASTITPSTSAGISKSFAAMAMWDRFDVPVSIRRVFRYIWSASRHFLRHVNPYDWSNCRLWNRNRSDRQRYQVVDVAGPC